ncbi:uncharacterized protein LOC141666673 [Apium graveolens]|uniref:uncharacterized protein LOC141666673 n=1 Tax=Apium graveolens TaxID=4045 RepID=UPI003D7A3F9C
MTKKKATMTLKDFHGGSIPSDLPLPSAPGAIVRQSDRVGLNVWGPIGRGDYRLRPGSASSVRLFDHKRSFMTHIGRNFDEDDRTPLDGVSGPRRTVSDDSICVPVVGVEKSGVEFVVEGTRPVSNPGLGVGRFVGGGSVGGNPWMMNEMVGKDRGVSCWSGTGIGMGTDVVTKLTHASAVEKVSSGRWHSKQVADGNPVDIEVISHPGAQIVKGYGMFDWHVHGNVDDMRDLPQIGKGYGVFDWHVHGNVDVVDKRDLNEEILVRQMEKNLVFNDGVHEGGRVLPVYERAAPPFYSDVQENRIYDEGHQASRAVGNFVRSELQQTLNAESSERPKLNLLPRSMPSVEPPPTNYEQPYQKPRDPGHHSQVPVPYERVSTYKSDPESGREVQDRPKLNLKPRMQPLDQLERNTETKRSTLFGGARPREMVLKERGINDVNFNNYDQVNSSNRLKQDVPRGEIWLARYNGKSENAPLDHRIGKNTDRRDHRGGVEKSDIQGKNWRSENRRSSRDLEKNRPLVARAPSPETWRKPVEQPSSTTGIRHGKVASAVELARAFSKSVSDPKIADGLSGQRGLPGRGQIPFSRLTVPQSRPQMNGY